MKIFLRERVRVSIRSDIATREDRNDLGRFLGMQGRTRRGPILDEITGLKEYLHGPTDAAMLKFNGRAGGSN